jgi:hypothetical protein
LTTLRPLRVIEDRLQPVVENHVVNLWVVLKGPSLSEPKALNAYLVASQYRRLCRRLAGVLVPEQAA